MSIANPQQRNDQSFQPHPQQEFNVVIDRPGVQPETIPASYIPASIPTEEAPSITSTGADSPQIEPVHFSYGRRYAADPADAYFPMAAFLPMESKIQTKIWETGQILNQGLTSSCVGHAWSAWFEAEPTMTRNGPNPFLIYENAQQRDPWKGTPHDGTTVRAAADWLKENGYIDYYVWARTAFDIRDWIINKGTVVMGTTWYDEMNHPNPVGFVQVRGEPEGGHAWLCYGYDAELDAFLGQNSWGPAWAKNGKFYIKFDELNQLLRSFGEACAAIERSV